VVVESHAFLVATIQRGTKKIFQTTMQKQLRGAIDPILEVTYTAARDVLLLISSAGDGSA
jgi:hypothetical protein